MSFLREFSKPILILLLSCIAYGGFNAFIYGCISRKDVVDPYSEHRYIEVDGHEYIAFPLANDSITHSPKCKCLVPQKPIPAPAPTPSPAKPNRKVNIPDKQGKTHYIMPTVEVTK